MRAVWIRVVIYIPLHVGRQQIAAKGSWEAVALQVRLHCSCTRRGQAHSRQQEGGICDQSHICDPAHICMHMKAQSSTRGLTVRSCCSPTSTSARASLSGRCKLVHAASMSGSERLPLPLHNVSLRQMMLCRNSYIEFAGMC